MRTGNTPCPVPTVRYDFALTKHKAPDTKHTMDITLIPSIIVVDIRCPGVGYVVGLEVGWKWKLEGNN